MTKPADDLEAIRLVIQALEPFDSKDRERIVRWAEEKLGMTSASTITPPTGSAAAPNPALPHQAAAPAPTPATGVKDIKTFVMAKQPKSDNQMAAVVAYFHHFEAAAGERKESIGKEDLIDACRKSDRKRPARPEQVLVNTYHAGLLDKAGTAGQYRLNSVGENLVAMVLPEQSASPRRTTNKAKTARRKLDTKKPAKSRSTTSKSK